ncbi:hypothetical protein SS50377_20925 [Spironucleus salmonicida]|uniref:Uncharacterized protein n=1 Tax=Spironucleus salmonicida TaxID=348837 RepID=V6LH12_9EUKA|nr:hypothetical protein SS50377_20925 [Spironucleus salmonicida]|eukprot:EST43598.1 hypothetical protein SS50377_16640 [Spironucleus salmonicida]
MSRKLSDELIEIAMRVKPQTREYRRISQNRDLMEKQRVQNRVENYERHDQAQVVATSYNEHNRFGDSFEDMERQRQRQKKDAKTLYLQEMGQMARQRDQFYKEKDIGKDERYQQDLVTRGSKKNVSGEPFNILTREYHNPQLQEELENQAQKDYVAAQARKEQLAKKSGLGYNMLTGEEYNWRK